MRTISKNARMGAFTLIELLVVISIIALLLSILMPGLQKAKQHALRMLCRTNLHSYGIASNMYLMEYDDKFPDPWRNIYKEFQFSGESERYCRWHNPIYSLAGNEEFQGPLWSYLEAEDINLCPVFAKLGGKFGEQHLPGSCIGPPFDPQFGYSQNAYLGDSVGNEWLEGVVSKSSQVKSPARTFFFAEENSWQMNPGAPSYNGEPYPDIVSTYVLNDTALLPRISPDDTKNPTDAFATFHSAPSGNYNAGTGNAVMMDGSIEAVQPFDQETFRKAWPHLGGF